MKAAEHSPPDFEILMPDTQLYPVVFNSPHSGAHYSSDFILSSRLKPLALRKSEDSFVDQLFQCVGDQGCPLLKANFPRAFLDVNRAPWELDPKMFADRLPDYVQTKTLRVMGGLGTIARNVSEGQKIYHSKLLFSQAKARIERYYFPYHQALKDLINQTQNQFGQSLLIDCHSMPSNISPSNTGRLLKSRSKNADIILGDRNGTACNAAMVDLLEDLFKNAGLSTTRNKPYAGGHITQTWGRPNEDCHAIQIEINRGLYMDEKAITKTAGFTDLQKSITKIFTQFLQSNLFVPVQTSLAAE